MTGAPVVILGGGPAGASAALWCKTLGLPVILLDVEPRIGGQLHKVFDVMDNIPGMIGVTGANIAHTLGEQLATAGVSVRYGCRATLDPGALRVCCAPEEAPIEAAAVVIATGVRRRPLGVPGEQELLGKGVEYHIGPEPARIRDMRVLVIGGGDDAFEHIRLAAPYAREITLVHRSGHYSRRPPVAAAAVTSASPHVSLRPFTVVEAIEGHERVEKARLRGPEGVYELPVDMIFVCIGPTPNTEGLPVALDKRGYVVVDELQRTSRPGVWAAGDVCCPDAPTIPTAMGQGAVAAKAISAALFGLAQAAPRSAAIGKDMLRIEGLTFPARIGVYPRERRRTQALSFSIEFEVDAAGAAPSDALVRTIDYAEVAATIERILAARHFNLIETVSDTVAAALLERFPTRRARVRVTKPGVPQAGSSAAIEVERIRLK
jgi:thioredoxin reductase (NADPH)